MVQDIVVAKFGSILRTSLSEVNDLDLICKRPVPLSRLLKLSKSLGKPLDVFIAPVNTEEWNGKYYILPTGKYKVLSTFCGRDFFYGYQEVPLAELEALV